MNRRQFLKNLVSVAFGVVLTNDIDFSPFLAKTAALTDEDFVELATSEYLTWIKYTMRLYIDNPSQLGIITGITDEKN